MRRGTIFLIIFVLIAAGVIGASLFIKNQPPVTITVAVDPLGETWLRGAVTDFNANEILILNGTRRVQVDVQVRSDLDVWRPSGSGITWTTQNHPAAWIPSSSISLNYANHPFEVVQPSLAKTVLIFAGYKSRVDVLTDGGAEALSWADVINAAKAGRWQNIPGSNPSWQNVNLAFSLPDRRMDGLGTLFSAAAALSDSAALTNNAVRGNFYTEFQPVILSRPTSATGNDIAAFMARSGPAAVNIAIAPENLWLNSLTALLNHEPVRFSYPDYDFVFDFPLAIWDDGNTTHEQREAVQAFGNWLLNESVQRGAMEHGLRPASGIVEASASLFFEAQQYGIEFTPDISQVIQPPLQSDTQGLLTWFQTVR